MVCPIELNCLPIVRSCCCSRLPICLTALAFMWAAAVEVVTTAVAAPTEALTTKRPFVALIHPIPARLDIPPLSLMPVPYHNRKSPPTGRPSSTQTNCSHCALWPLTTLTLAAWPARASLPTGCQLCPTWRRTRPHSGYPLPPPRLLSNRRRFPLWSLISRSWRYSITSSTGIDIAGKGNRGSNEVRRSRIFIVTTITRTTA